MSAAAGRPKGIDGELQERTKHGVLVNQRIRAIVGLVIDELEHRRSKGKSDFIATLATEVEKGGLAAWESLQKLLPRDADVAGKVPVQNNVALFVQAAREIAERDRLREPMASLLELTANLGAAPDTEPAAFAKTADDEFGGW